MPVTDPSLILSAGIAAIPASIAAVASWRAARQVQPSNGKRLAEIVEASRDLSEANHDTLRLLADKVSAHILDQQAHAREQHAHYQAAEGTCPGCLGLTEGD